MKVEYYGRNSVGMIHIEDDATFVPEQDDEVCLPLDDEYPAGGWNAFDVRNRRYIPEENKVICYVEKR